MALYEIIYIVEKDSKLVDRLTVHICSIQSNFSYFPVAWHVNAPPRD